MRVERLETRCNPSGNQLLALSQDGSSIVAVYASGGTVGPPGGVNSIEGVGRLLTRDLDPYPFSTGGVRVAVGDVTGDNIDDVVTAPGPGTRTVIKVYDGGALLNGRINLVREFEPFGPNYNRGAYVATGQVNLASFAREIVVGKDRNDEPRVRVFDQSGGLLQDFLAYDANFRGGVRVASGDANGDGREDVITAAGPGGGPHVKIFDANNPNFVIDQFFAYDASFLGGVYVAAGEIDGVPNRTDIATGAGEGGGPHLKVWSAAPFQRYFTKAERFVGAANNLSGIRVGVANLGGATQQSVYVGFGANFSPAFSTFNSDPRLSAFRMRDFISGVPVQPGSVLARSFLLEDRLSLFDPFPVGRAGGLYIGV
jgi:hypothetical protein